MRRSRPEPSEAGPGDFGSYLHAKRQKLSEQYAAAASSAICSTDDSKKQEYHLIFAGVVAFVSNSIFCTITRNGKDQPVDHREISRLLQLHGARLLPKHDKDMTHFVCSAVPVWMQRDQEKHRSKFKFVSPMWVIDSVVEGARLDASQYFPNPQAPMGLSKPPPTNAATVALPNIMNLRPMGQQQQPQQLKRIGDLLPRSLPREPSSKQKPSIKKTSAAPSHVVVEINDSVEESAGAPLRLNQAATNEKLTKPMPSWYNQTSVQNKPVFRPTSLPGGAGSNENGPGQMLTSKENPNFVSDYFASSRLHHLSRWRIDFQQQLTSHLLNIGSEEEAGAQQPPPVTESTLDADRIIAHIDMDAFFVSVSTRNRPELAGKPIVVSHGGARGTCASVNYIARQKGVRNGVRLAEAEQLCGSDLVVVPYDFDAYEQVSKKMYEVFLKYSRRVQVLSCDEALLELTDAADHNFDAAIAIVERIRKEVKEKTGCDCSAGLGNSRVLASLALKNAKPNGCIAAPKLLDPKSPDFSFMQRVIAAGTKSNPIASDLERSMGGLTQRIIESSPILKWLSTFKISHMKGIGPAIEDKLEEMSVKTIGKLQLSSLSSLQTTFGEKVGIKLFLAARGLDDKPLKFLQERKSVSVELSFGVRFDTINQVFRFIEDVAQELHRRAIAAGVRGKTIVLNVMQRHPEAKPTTFLGHGWCITHSKGQTLPEPTNSPEVFRSIGVKIFRNLNVPPTEVRGIGLHLSHLTRTKGPSGMRSLDSMVTNLNQSKPPPAAPAQPEHAPQAPSRQGFSRRIEAIELEANNDDEDENDNDDHLMQLDDAMQHQANPPAHQRQQFIAIDVDSAPSQDISELEHILAPIVAPETSAKVLEQLTKVADRAAELGAPSDTILELLVQYGISLLYSRSLEDIHSLLSKLKRFVEILHPV